MTGWLAGFEFFHDEPVEHGWTVGRFIETAEVVWLDDNGDEHEEVLTSEQTARDLIEAITWG